MTTSVQTFAPHCGELFAATTSAGAIELRLHAVEPHSSEATTSFTLVFHGPPSPLLQQGTFEMQHDALGMLAIFLVPTAVTPSHAEYEAVFNA